MLLFCQLFFHQSIYIPTTHGFFYFSSNWKDKEGVVDPSPPSLSTRPSLPTGPTSLVHLEASHSIALAVCFVSLLSLCCLCCPSPLTARSSVRSCNYYEKAGFLTAHVHWLRGGITPPTSVHRRGSGGAPPVEGRDWRSVSCARVSYGVSYGVSSECFVVLFFDRFRLPVLGINPGTRGLSLSLFPPFFSLLWAQ